MERNLLCFLEQLSWQWPDQSLQFQSEQFYQYLKDSFDVLYAEGDPQGLDRPKMLSVGMHCRLLGRPGRMRALQRFLDYAQSHDKVWVCRRIDIARHWQSVHPHRAQA